MIRAIIPVLSPYLLPPISIVHIIILPRRGREAFLAQRRPSRRTEMRGDDNNIVRTYGHREICGKMIDRDCDVRVESRIGTVGDLRSGVGTVVRFDLGDSGVDGKVISGSRAGSEIDGKTVSGSRVGESKFNGKLLQIESTHEFPNLHSSSHGSSIGVQCIQDSVPCDKLCNSHEVAMDNRQGNGISNSNGNALGGDNSNSNGNALGIDSKTSMLGSNSNSNVKNTCMYENDVDGSQSLSPRRTPVSKKQRAKIRASIGNGKSCVVSDGNSNSKSKAIGGKSNDNNNNDDDDDDDCTVWRSCVRGNPPSLGKAEGQVPGSQSLLPYDGLLEQECLNLPLSQIGGRASNEPKASNGPEAKSLQFGSDDGHADRCDSASASRCILALLFDLNHCHRQAPHCCGDVGGSL